MFVSLCEIVGVCVSSSASRLSASRLGVPNWRPSASRIGVPNWRPELGPFQPVPNWGSSASRMSYLLRYRFGGWGWVGGVFQRVPTWGGPKQGIPARPEWGPFPWLLIRRGPGKSGFGGLWGFWGGGGCKFGSFLQFFRIWGISPPPGIGENGGGGGGGE